MIQQSLKKLVRMHDPVFTGTDDPEVFWIQAVPYYMKKGIEVHLPPVTLGRVKLVKDEEIADTNFSVWNSETLSNDTLFVVFV